MKMEITVTEALELISEIRKQPNDLFEMIRADVKESVGQYMSELMDTELTEFLGRKRYERIDGMANHRNGSYGPSGPEATFKNLRHLSSVFCQL